MRRSDEELDYRPWRLDSLQMSPGLKRDGSARVFTLRLSAADEAGLPTSRHIKANCQRGHHYITKAMDVQAGQKDSRVSGGPHITTGPA
jgi:hypothetical protein